MVDEVSTRRGGGDEVSMDFVRDTVVLVDTAIMKFNLQNSFSRVVSDACDIARPHRRSIHRNFPLVFSHADNESSYPELQMLAGHRV